MDRGGGRVTCSANTLLRRNGVGMRCALLKHDLYCRLLELVLVFHAAGRKMTVPHMGAGVLRQDCACAQPMGQSRRTEVLSIELPATCSQMSTHTRARAHTHTHTHTHLPLPVPVSTLSRDRNRF